MIRLAALALILLAGCPRNGDKQPKRSESSGSGSAIATTPEVRDAAGPPGPPGPIELPPPPPLPTVPQSLPALPAQSRVTSAAVAFGELLFADPRLSASGSRTCANCHDPARGFSGGVDVAANGTPNARRTPALVNLAWVRDLGWDGRVPGITQLLPAHMAGQLDTLDAATTRIAAVSTYAAHIARVGGTPAEAIVQALEAYALTRYEGDAPWDSLERTERTTTRGTPTNPIVAGYQLFVGKAQCGQCHTPPLYTDNKYHRVVKDAVGDAGRGLVDPKQAGAFRTPTLRGAMIRGSYFHDGSQSTLDGVIRYYQSDAAKSVNPAFRKLTITDAEARQLAMFVTMLTSNRPAPQKPALP